jgi:hypothetical protein
MWPVTAESVNRQPLGSQQVRIAALIVVAIVVGVVLWLVLGHNSKKKHHKTAGTTVLFGPKLYKKASGLKGEAGALGGQPIYWAGKQSGLRYEFTQLKNGHIFIRYLPKGVKNGAKGAHYLIVATYAYRNAYKALKKLAKTRALHGPGHSVIYVRPNDPKSVLIAWPKVQYEVEIYDPRPSYARQVAESGQVAPIPVG